MKGIYKKIMTVDYSDKLFTIFLADNNRRAFLETNKEGKYFYPLLEDFIKLNDIYNNKNPFIANITKFKFKEKVKVLALSSLLGVVIVATATCANNYSIRTTDDSVILTQNLSNDKELILLSSTEDLDKLLGYKSVSIDETHRAIDNNETIPDSYKLKAHIFLTIFMIEHPNWDLRIFYENIKTLNFNSVDDNYFANLNEMAVSGRYNAQFNELILPNNASDDTFYHELSHMFDLFCREYEDKIFARWVDVGRCTLVEAMTNDLAGVITDVESYEKYEAIIDYFRNYVEFSYDDFNQKGINYFVDLLCKKYPKVDIEFILCALDTINDTEKAKNQFFFLDSVDDLTDEIFKICTTELNNASENYYAPFWEFARVLYYTSDIKNPASDNQPEIMYEYLDRYNDLLIDMGYKGEFITKEKILEKVGKYKDIEYIFYKENSAIPVVGTFSKEEENGRLGFYLQTFDEDGNKIEMLQGDYSHPITYITNLYYFMQITGVEYFDIIGTDEYWKMVGIDSGCMKVKDIESVPIYLDGELLGNEFIDNLTISIGLASDGALAYEIKKEDGYLLYSSDDLANNTSNPFPLNKFLSNYNPKDFSSLELKNVLNDAYLKNLLITDCFFSNVIIQDNELKFMPTYRIEVEESFGTYNLELGDFYFGIDNDVVKLYPLEYVTGFEGKVYLKDILTYYNVLDEDTLLYKFTKDELMNYYEQYMIDINREKENSMGL